MLNFDGLEKFQMCMFLDYKNYERDFKITQFKKKRL